MSYILGPSALGWTGGLVPGKFRNFQRLKAFILPISIAFIIRSLFFFCLHHISMKHSLPNFVSLNSSLYPAPLMIRCTILGIRRSHENVIPLAESYLD
jgi:hypothetical protein